MTNPVKMIPPDIEISIIKDTLGLIARSGIFISLIWVAKILVALKSKPLMILVGPQEAAKEILIKNFFDTLIDSDHYRYQTMMGHPCGRIRPGMSLLIPWRIHDLILSNWKQ